MNFILRTCLCGCLAIISNTLCSAQPLQRAIASDDLLQAKELISKKKEIDAADKKGRSPIFYLIVKTAQARTTDTLNAQNWEKLALRLIESGININLVAENGRTPVAEALIMGEQAIAERLFEKGAQIPVFDYYLFLAAETGAIPIVKALLAKGIDVNAPCAAGDATPLHAACLNGNKEIAEILLAKGAKLDVKTNDKTLFSLHTPLHFAVLSGDTALVQLLLSRGADPNAASGRGFTPLHYAASGFSMEDFKQGFLNERLFTPVFYENILAGRLGAGNPAMVSLLVRYGADARRCDKDGICPIHFAALHGSLPIVELLERNGANPNAITSDSTSPLHLACAVGQITVINHLSQMKFPIIEKTFDGEDSFASALMYVAAARQANHTEVYSQIEAAGRLFRRAEQQFGEIQKKAARVVWTYNMLQIVGGLGRGIKSVTEPKLYATNDYGLWVAPQNDPASGYDDIRSAFKKRAKFSHDCARRCDAILEKLRAGQNQIEQDLFLFPATLGLYASRAVK